MFLFLLDTSLLPTYYSITLINKLRLSGEELQNYITNNTSEWLSFPRPSAARTPRRGVRASRGRVPEVSLHTAVKGQFGLGTGRAMGKALKKAMFLGKLYRKKRRLSLSPLHSPPKARKLLRGMWRPPTQNVPGQERNWYDAVFYSHAAFCGCGDCIGHLSRLAVDLGRPPSAHPPPQLQPPALRRLPALPAPPNPSGDRAAWPTWWWRRPEKTALEKEAPLEASQTSQTKSYLPPP